MEKDIRKLSERAKWGIIRFVTLRLSLFALTVVNVVLVVISLLELVLL